MVDGVSHPATSCKGYETDEPVEQAQEPVEESTNNVDAPTTNGNTPNPIENVKDGQRAIKEGKAVKNEDARPRGYTSEWGFMSGGSVERNGVW